jgi:heptaprenylglyceryl phosphate synthase
VTFCKKAHEIEPIKINTMIKRISTLMLIISIMFLSSCATMLSGYNSFGTTTVLNAANFDYVKKNVSGKSEVKYILGLGGNKKEAMINEAKQELFANHPLKANQALANVTIDYKNKMVFGNLIQKVTCTINADVVEFTK